MKNRLLYSGILTTENSKGPMLNTFIKSYVEDKDAPPSYQYISPNISTVIDAKTRVMKYHHKNI